MRWVLVAVAAAAAVIVVVTLLFVATFDANQYRELILGQLSQTLGRPIQAQEIDLQLIPLRLRLKNVSVSEADGFSGEVFFSADVVQADVDLGTLLAGRPTILALELLEPTLYLRQNSNSQWNLAQLGGSGTPAAPASEAEPVAPQAPLRNWSLWQGNVVIEPWDRDPIYLGQVDLVLTDISTSKPFPFQFSTILDPSGLVELEGSLGPLNLDFPAATPITARLQIQEMEASLLNSLLPLPQQLSLLDASMDIVSEQTGTRLQGSVGLTDESGDSLTVTSTVRFSADGTELQLSETTVDYLSVQALAEGRVELGPQPTLDLRLELRDSSLEAARSIPPRLGFDIPLLPNMKGQLNLEVRASGALATPSISAQAQIKDLEVLLSSQGEAVRASVLKASYQPDRIRLETLQLMAVGGNYRGMLEISQFDAPQVTFDLKGDLLDVAAWQNLLMVAEEAPAARETGKEAAVPDWLKRTSAEGTLHFDKLLSNSMELESFSANAVLSRGVLVCKPIEFGLYGGKGGGDLRLDLRPDEPVIQFQGNMQEVDVNQMVSAHSQSKDRIFGRLNGSLQVTFVAAETGLLGTSQGNGQMNLVEGRLAKLSLSRGLSGLSEMIGLKVDREDTPIERMTATFRIADSWLRSQDLYIETPDLTLTAQGGFGFDGTLELEGLATFARESVEEKGSGRGLLGGLSGAFPRDKEDRPLLPYQIVGTFDKPTYSLDTARLSRMMGKGFLDSILGQKEQE